MRWKLFLFVLIVIIYPLVACLGSSVLPNKSGQPSQSPSTQLTPGATPKILPADTPVLQTAILGQPFQLRGGQAVALVDENLTVRFAAVLEDSRCPRNVTCVWSGRARLQVVLQKGQEAESILEVNSLPGQVPVQFQSYQITLAALDPYPEEAGRTYKLSDYLMTIVVERVTPRA